jgi:hypothetical protein
VLSRTIITSMTTVLATAAIYLVGGGLVRDFAFAMLFGVIFGTYSSIYVSNSLMLWTTEWFEKRAASRPPGAKKSSGVSGVVIAESVADGMVGLGRASRGSPRPSASKERSVSSSHSPENATPAAPAAAPEAAGDREARLPQDSRTP